MGLNNFRLTAERGGGKAGKLDNISADIAKPNYCLQTLFIVIVVVEKNKIFYCRNCYHNFCLLNNGENCYDNSGK